ncbi:MAG TPA: DUF2231 domain-containing protein [Tepidisphaeraceae bacterium]
MDVEFVNPNLHVALVHYPLALLVVGTLIELFSFLWRRHGFRLAGRWMILLGALTAIPTVTSGIYALYDVANPTKAAVPWKEVVNQRALSDQQWEMLRDHLLQESIAAGLAVLVVVTWLACSDRWRRNLHVPLLVLLLVSVGLAAAGAWHGGEAIYRFGTGVQKAGGDSLSSAATQPGKPLDKVEYYAPPMQMHVILAGTAVAIALASLGLSIRKLTQFLPPPQVDHIAAALGESSASEFDRTNRMPDPQDIPHIVGLTSRFWVLASLVAILTAGVGYFILASGSGMWSLADVWKELIKPSTRRLAHAVAGVSIIVLPLILAMLARWGPRRKWTLALFSLLLLVAIAFQIWLGILLLFDTSEGSLTRFN